MYKYGDCIHFHPNDLEAVEELAKKIARKLGGIETLVRFNSSVIASGARGPRDCSADGEAYGATLCDRAIEFRRKNKN